MGFFIQLVFITALIFAVPALLYLLGRRYAPRIFRRAAYEIHLWLGIVSGLILFVVCLSGTLLTFKTETIMFLEKDRYYISVPTGAKPKTLEELVPMVEKAENGKVVRVTIPEASNRSWVFNVRKNESERGSRRPGNASGGRRPGSASSESRPETVAKEQRPDSPPSEGKAGPDSPRRRPQNASVGRGAPSGMPASHAMLGSAYLVNPYTGESLGPQRSGVYMFFMMLQFLHRFLLLDIRTGQLIVGTATLVFVVLIVGGLFLWLPAKLKFGKSWLPGLKVRRRKGWNRFIYDAHNTLGFYALIPLMIMALTGPIISFSWYRSAAGKMLGTVPFSKAFEKPLESDWNPAKKRDLTWDDFLVKANDLSARKGLTQIYLPQSPKSGVSVRKIGEGFFSIAATDKIQFDQYSGTVLQSDLFDEYSFGEKISTLIFPLHNGEIFGTVSKIAYFIACLIATTLPLSGVILWIGKLRTRRKAKKKRLQLAAEEKTEKQDLSVAPKHPGGKAPAEKPEQLNPAPGNRP